MSDLLGLSIILIACAFLTLLFTKERNNKVGYIKNVGFIFIISQLCTLVTIPIYGNIFGATSMALTSVVLGTMKVKNE